MTQEEQQFLTDLAEMASCLQTRDKWWSDKFEEDTLQAQKLFNHPGDLNDKYALTRRVLSYYESGMGGLHEIVPDELGHVKSALFESTRELLRMYWREVGREWHDYSRFEIIPEGTQVKLIPTTIIYQRPDYPETVVPDTAAVAKQVWSIVRLEGPDVTNMPSYLIRCGSSFRSARHESLEVVANSEL